MGNIISVSRDGKQKKAYTYDALNRIISEKDIDKEQEICYTYDNNGNILTKSVNGVVTSYAYEEGTDRLTSYGAETIGYDGMGNPKSYRGSELTWEKGRRLTSIEDETGEVTFGYDVFGQRNQKTAGGETTNYVYENGKLLRQTTGSEVMTFIYGSEGIIGFRLGTSRYLYRKNVFGDVEEIYSAEGMLVGKYSYTAFGECEIETDENGIATKNPIRYRGYYFDEETGFYYLKTRYYDPVVGRFITIDDVSYLAPDTINGLNLYAYCGNNPVMRVDENGNVWWNPFSWDWGAIGRFIGGGLLLLVGAALTVITARLAVVPGMAIIPQFTFSMAIYGGYVAASAFSDTIYADMSRIHWNPFNSDTSLVGKSGKVSFYKGVPVFRHNFFGSSASIFGMIFLHRTDGDEYTIRHEWGHIAQAILMGQKQFLIYIALPSVITNIISRYSKTVNDMYYSFPWERSADFLGGVDRGNYKKGSLAISLLYLFWIIYGGIRSIR